MSEYLYMFLSTGLDQAVFRDWSGAYGASKLNENERFYGFTDFRGKRPGGGGGDAQLQIKLPPVIRVSTHCVLTTTGKKWPVPNSVCRTPCQTLASDR